MVLNPTKKPPKKRKNPELLIYAQILSFKAEFYIRQKPMLLKLIKSDGHSVYLNKYKGY